MNYFKNVKSLEELKKVYRELAMKHHPDKGGDLETMKQINNEYDQMFELLKKEQELENNFKEIIDELIKYSDITIEAIGTWIWVTGNTKPIKDTLKSLKFTWAKKKDDNTAWFFKPEGYKKLHKKQFSLDEIRSMHDSKVLKGSVHRPQLTF